MNFQKMLQQAATQMQKKMSEFEKQTFDFHYKEYLSFQMMGNGEIINLKISPALIDPEDPETLQDILSVAINEARKEIDAKKEAIQNNLSNSMPKGFF